MGGRRCRLHPLSIAAAAISGLLPLFFPLFAAVSFRKMALHGKVIIVGPANVGKTCLLERFVRDVFAGDNMSHGPTLGCDCLTKSLTVDQTEITLYMYDTAGQ